MKFIFPDISNIFNTEIDKVNCIVIENQLLFRKIIEDIDNQIQGLNGLSIISKENKELAFSKNTELLTSFVPFDINQKNLLSKLNSNLESQALSDEMYAKTMELISSINAFLYDLSFNYNCDIDFPKLSIGSIVKASGVELDITNLSLPEKILDYIEISNDLLGNKLFFLVNIRSFISNEEMELLLQSILSHKYDVILLESLERTLLNSEKRYIIDTDLCEISY